MPRNKEVIGAFYRALGGRFGHARWHLRLIFAPSVMKVMSRVFSPHIGRRRENTLVAAVEPVAYNFQRLQVASCCSAHIHFFILMGTL
jgi:hypothetical protein